MIRYTESEVFTMVERQQYDEVIRHISDVYAVIDDLEDHVENLKFEIFQLEEDIALSDPDL